VANRSSDISGESIIQGITSEMSRQRAGCVCVCVCVCVCSGKNIKCFDFIKEIVFCNFSLAYFPCRLHPPPYFLRRGGSLEGSDTQRPIQQVLGDFSESKAAGT